jgi:succinyl-diaminopimelate desuccinylase
MKILEIVKKNQEEMIKDMQGLLRIDATLEENPDSLESPFGEGIKESLNYVLELGRSFGFNVVNHKNIAGHIEYGKGEEIIGILCHVDTVPAVGKWKYPPFSATVEGNKLYSRGASDDKGPTISSLYALKALKDLNIKLNKRVRLIIGTDEETAWRGITDYFKHYEMPEVGFSPDADYPVIYGEKGIMSIDVESNELSDILFKAGVRYNVVPDEASVKLAKDVKDEFNKYLEKFNLEGSVSEKLTLIGKTAHAMEPNGGINAIIKLVEFLKNHSSNNLVKFIFDKLTDTRFKKMGLNFSDPEMKDLTVNVAILEIKEKHGKLGLNLRYPINWDKDEFFKEFSKQASSYGLTAKIISNQNPHYVDKEDPLVKTLHNAYSHYSKDDVTPLLTIGGGTYARALKKGVAFGATFPGNVDVAHQPDEYINLDEIVLSTAIIAKAVADLGK